VINDPGESLDHLLERTRQALTALQDGDAAGPFVGEADDGRVRAEVTLDGRLRTLNIDPYIARSMSDVGPLVVEAVNAALDSRPGRSVDLSALVANLREVQEQSLVEMRRITQSFTGALAETLGRAGADGGTGADGRVSGNGRGGAR